ncbi:MAG: GMC family oxidoreductase N-terminal domain-containing protein [Alphaproteobacteria bacterium]|nr:GMC family oxidoreductase N-terminal domain-containing protein [Alphaproteobacteria bacterium]
MTDSFDYVIVGAGSAGSVLANRLSAGDATVCVLEAGGRDRHPFIHIPAGFMKTLTSPSVNWLYETEPSTGTAGRSIPAPRGKTLGGSSSINGHVYNRGQSMDFDSWAQMGNRGWGYADVLPYFRRGERRIGGSDDGTYHGTDGELTVTDIDATHPLCDAFVEGCVNMGIPYNPDYNGATHEGVGYFQRTIHRGRRVSAATSFLHPAMNRPNLEVRTRAQVEKILFDGRRAVGVRYRKGGRSVEVRARREIVLSGGAIASPQILQVSGIGPARLLGEIGVPVIHDLPAVGENLSDHYLARNAARVHNAPSLNERARGLALVSEVFTYATRRTGLLALSPSLVHVFWKSDPALDKGDLQFIFTPASYKDGRPAELETYPGMTIASWPMRPQSRGYVRAKSSDTRDKPAIQPNYLDHEYDQRLTIAGLRLGREMIRTPEMASIFVEETTPGEDVQSDDELLHFARTYGTTVFHLMGSCRMGPDSDPNCVVDDELRVRGVEGLRVADASVIPAAHSTNTNAATIMIAEKASDMILGKPPLPAAQIPKQAAQDRRPNTHGGTTT